MAATILRGAAAATTYEAGVEINRLTDVMGAEVMGLDLNEAVGADVERTLNRALLDHHVLCLRGQTLSAARYCAAGRIFGEPQIQLVPNYFLEGTPEISVVSNYNNIGEDEPRVRATYWHTDDSYFAVPAKTTMLYAKVLPSNGGETHFINSHAVLKAMPQALRARIEGRRAIHKYQSRRAGAKVSVRTESEEAVTPDVSHPMIRIHGETGLETLYINPNRIDTIEGMDEAESDLLLDELYEFAFQPRFQYRHQWRLGDLVVWDNPTTMHKAGADFDQTERRELHRLLLKGSKPV